MVTMTTEILTINLLHEITFWEETGWSLRFILVQGPKALVTFDVPIDHYRVTTEPADAS